MSKPLLSICIPTYNRVDYLRNSLESIINQEEFKLGKVEIIISDNASTDNTKEVAQKYADTYKNIFFYSNEENINNNNFPLALSRGTGCLRRLCNDTLCFKNGALNYICNIIEKYKYKRPYIFWGNIEKNSEIQEMNFRDGIKEIGYWITSIASFSIWDSECEKIENDTNGAELLLWQVRKALELMSKKNEVVIVNKNISYIQGVKNKNVSYGLYHIFCENYFKIINPYLENGLLTYEDIEFLEKNLLVKFFPEWCVKWKIQNKEALYSKTEDLYECLYQRFHNKKYWYQFRINYIKFTIKYKIKK